MSEALSLQEGIDRAGSALQLLWKPGQAPWQPPVVPDEFVGWRVEQAAAEQSVALFEQSHHMENLFIEGADATRVLRDLSPNDFESFEVGQAKQVITVNSRGQQIGDGILLREAEHRYVVSGTQMAQSWIRYHGERGDYDVTFRVDPNSAFRDGKDPEQFRFEIQGPRALELVERVFGGPLPKTKFFHSTAVTLGGRHFRALRHGMAGQPGYEFVGEWKDGAFVKDTFLEHGATVGLIQVGAKGYATNGIESGWVSLPTPAIYSDPALRDYREWLRLYSFEGQFPMHGSFYSDDIEDFYCSPFELGYGRLMKFNHDFLGREALERSRETRLRQKVTLVLDPDDVRRVFGDLDYFASFGRYRVEMGDELSGMTYYSAHIAPRGTIVALAIVAPEHAEPGTEVSFVWGEHPGAGTAPDADLGFERIRANVCPTPYNEFARTQYRKNS